MPSRSTCLRLSIALTAIAACAVWISPRITGADGQTARSAPSDGQTARSAPSDGQTARSAPSDAPAGAQPTAARYRALTPDEEYVILHKGTERPFSGEYNDHFAAGAYTCRRCGAMLYRAEHKFRSHCGWPAFEDEIPNAVTRLPDADGQRTEITCANCGAHLGHVFLGERFTAANTRHCVNSVSLDFVPQAQLKYGRAIFAGGCFWGVEHWLQQEPGVIQVTSGYTGGTTKNPTYKQVSGRKTRHAESVEVLYDPVRISFEDLARVFFEIHDSTQPNGQGPDIGSQYRSAIFYIDDGQRRIAEKLIAQLKARGLNVVTRLARARQFWPAEDYHQDYYERHGASPVCQTRRKLW